MRQLLTLSELQFPLQSSGFTSEMPLVLKSKMFVLLSNLSLPSLFSFLSLSILRLAGIIQCALKLKQVFLISHGMSLNQSGSVLNLEKCLESIYY